MSLVSCVTSCTTLIPVLATIVSEYVNSDYITRKIETTFLEWCINLGTSVDELTLKFRRSLWKGDFPSAVKALQAGASYFPIKEEIWQLVE